MPVALDASWTRPTAGQAVAGGYVGALFYNGSTAHPSLDEINDYFAAGLGIAWIYETNEDWTYGGWWAGVGAAQFSDAFSDARGWPLDRPTFYAVDRPSQTPAQLQAIHDCFYGIASTSTRSHIGAYGSSNALRFAAQGILAARKIPVLWKVETWGEWFDSDPPLSLIQLANTKQPFIPGADPSTYDVDVVLTDDWGQHPYAGSTPSIPPEDSVIYQVTDAATDPKDNYTSTAGEFWREVGVGFEHGDPAPNEIVVPISGSDFIAARRRMLDVVAAAGTTLAGCPEVAPPVALDLSPILAAAQSLVAAVQAVQG